MRRALHQLVPNYVDLFGRPGFPWRRELVIYRSRTNGTWQLSPWEPGTSPVPARDLSLARSRAMRWPRRAASRPRWTRAAARWCSPTCPRRGRTGGGPALFADCSECPSSRRTPVGLLTEDGDHLGRGLRHCVVGGVRAENWGAPFRELRVVGLRRPLRRRPSDPSHHRPPQDRAGIRGRADRRQRGVLRLAHSDLPGILFLSSGIDYWAAVWLDRLPAGETRRRRLILAAIARDEPRTAGVLQVHRLPRSRWSRTCSGPRRSAHSRRSSRSALPMGISFYTFQSMSYTIDVYRGQLKPLRGFWPFFLFISFFPQLVAGPIVRAVEFLPQLPRPRRLRSASSYEGVWLIIPGFFLKMVCADNLAVYVDEHWERRRRPRRTSGFALWLALMFSGQIFADFAGYSNIARGWRVPARLPAPDQLQRAVPRRLVQELLGALAHHAVALAARLPVRATRRQPAGARPDLRQPAPRDGAGRAVARRRLHVPRLGSPPRRAPWRWSASSACTRTAAGRARAPCAPPGSSSSRPSSSPPWVYFRSRSMARRGDVLSNIAAIDHWAARDDGACRPRCSCCRS